MDEENNVICGTVRPVAENKLTQNDLLETAQSSAAD